MPGLEQLEERIIQLEELVLQQRRDISDLQRALYKKDEPVIDTAQKSDFESTADEGTSIEEVNLRRAYANLHKEGFRETKKSQEDMEKKIGNMMGIVASIMIFISVILFVTMVYSSMNEIMKIFCMFLFSGVILAAGVVTMNRNLNVFTMSLTGCGMGTVYLSLFITHIYFGRINQIVLYLLIITWAVGVYYFFGKKYLAFKIIGQAGITVSVIFGFLMFMSSGAEEGTWGKLLFLMGYFMVAAWFYLLADKAGCSRGNVVCVLMDEVSMLAFFILMFWVKGMEIGSLLVYAVFLIVNMLLFLWRYVYTGENRDDTLRGMWYVLLLGFTASVLYVVIEECIRPYGTIAAAAAAILVMAALLLIEISRKKRGVLHVLSVCVIYLLLFLFTESIVADEWLAVVYGVYAALLVWAGYRFADRTVVILSYASLVLAVHLLDEGWLLVLGTVVCVGVLAFGGVLLCREVRQYSAKMKLAYYVAVQLAVSALVPRLLLSVGASEILSAAWGFIFCAALSVTACQKFFARSFVDREVFETEVSNVAAALNGILMTWGSSLLFENELNNLMRFLILAVSAALYVVNVLPSYDRFGDHKGTGIYNGLKLSLYVLLVLKSYSFTGPVISIGWLILAIILIAFGFYFQYKYMRMYGLGLTMFSVCKLLIFDIDYGSPAVRAFSFLLSGVLCFVINLIYNRMQKDE